jgi:hypothetical protein
MVYYDDHEPECNSLKFIKSVDNGTGWSDPVTIDAKFWSGYQAPVDIVKFSNKLLVAYSHDYVENQEYTGEIILMESVDGGTSWTNRRSIVSDALNPQLASENGRLYLTYFTRDRTGIEFRTSSDGQIWSPPKTVGWVQFYISFTWIFSMAVKDGKVFVAYTKDNLAVPGPPENKCHINTSWDGGVDWTEITNATFTWDDSSDPSLFITGGRLHFFWINESLGQTMHRTAIFDRSFEDSDHDGSNDIEDAFPSDPEESVDTDSDGMGDNGDAFPADASASVDTDGDGHPDSWNNGKSQGDSNTGLKLDRYPNDRQRWNDSQGLSPIWLIVPIMGLIFVAIMVLVIRIIFKKSARKP